MRIHHILSIILIVSGIVAVVFSYQYSSNYESYIGFESLAIFILFCLLLVVLCSLTRLRYDALFLLFVLNVILFFNQRFCSLIVNPLVKIEYELFFPHEYFNMWLLVILYTLVVFIAIYFSKAIFGSSAIRRNNNMSSLKASVRKAKALFIICAVTQVYMFYYLGGDSENATGIKTTFFVKVLSILTRLDLVYMLLMALMFTAYREKGEVNWYQVIFYLMIFTLPKTLSGSRGGIFDGFIITIICLMVALPKYRIRITPRQITAIFILVIFAPLLFNVGDAIRHKTWNIDRSIENLGSINLQDLLEREEHLSTMYLISRRLSQIDPLLYISNEKYTIEPNKYINLDTVFKSAVNRVFPGDYFEPVLPPERTFAIVYYGRSEKNVMTWYHGDEYGLFGISQVMFGKLGGAIYLFFLIFILHRMYEARLFKNEIVYKALILYIFFFIFHSFGMDNTVARLAYLIPVYIIYWLIIKINFFKIILLPRRSVELRTTSPAKP